jgi:hypothetical protein
MDDWIIEVDSDKVKKNIYDSFTQMLNDAKKPFNIKKYNCELLVRLLYNQGFKDIEIRDDYTIDANIGNYQFKGLYYAGPGRIDKSILQPHDEIEYNLNIKYDRVIYLDEE